MSAAPRAVDAALPHPSRSGQALVIAAAAWAVTELATGTYFGFGGLLAHLIFWMLSGLLLLAGFMIADRVFPSSALADRAIRTSTLSLAVAVFCGLVLGVSHLLFRTSYVAAEALLVVAMLLVEPPPIAQADVPPSGIPLVVRGLAAAMVAFVIATGLSHGPFTLYDSLSYHLFFPARWLQAHRLAIIPTPFSDEAQAYQPANGELWFLWLMLPFHGDFLARAGQLPFYGLGAITVYALARRLGARPIHAWYAPLFFLITPTIVEQAVGANVDLIHAVLFATALYVGLVAVDTDSRADWALWGIIGGLWLGTKYLAVVYLPVILALPLVRGLRRRAVWALPGLAVFGASWYLRNWIMAGSPIYPATLSVAGVTIGQGAYTREAMTRSFLHTTDLRLLVVSLAHAYGAALFFVIVPAAALVTLALLVRRAWWPAGFVLLAVVTMVILCWLAVADNADSRFLLPAVVTSLALLPCAFRIHRRANWAVHALYIAGLAWTVVGADGSLRVALPWFMSDWLSLHGLFGRQYLLPFIAVAAAAIGVYRLTPRREWAIAAAVAVVGTASGVLAIGAETWCVPSRCDFLQLTSPHLRLDFLYGSRWLDSQAAPANVAYAGINLPYPLSGSHLEHVVSYVNIDRHTEWRFDHYARAYRRGEGHRSPSDAALATPSGLLMSANERHGSVDALRPRFERMSGARDAWEANLASRQVRYLFISTLDPYEIDYTWHDPQGFPIEADWAEHDPMRFHIVYENPEVRIYEVQGP